MRAARMMAPAGLADVLPASARWPDSLAAEVTAFEMTGSSYPLPN